jgi:acyl-CoA thioester hydrolase
MAEPARHEIEVDVRYAETDQMGVVHHANYLVWFELARTDLCATAGHRYADIERAGTLLMVVGADVRYRRSARYGDRLRLLCWIDRLRSRDLTFAYEVRCGDELLATGSTDHVWVARDTGRPTRAPDEVQRAFERLRGPG